MRVFLKLLCAFLACFSTLYGQSIKLEPKSTFICNGQNATIKLKLTGDFSKEEFILYNLNFDGSKTELGSITNDSIIFKPNFSSSIFIESSISKVRSDTVKLVVDPYSGLFLRYESEPVCEGYTNKIEIYTGLVNGDEIFWNKNGMVIQQAKAAIYLAKETGQYTAKVKRGTCTYDVGGKANLEFGKISPSNLTSNHSPEVCEGASVQITGTLPNIIDVKAQWFHENGIILGADKSTFAATESGNYTLQLSQGTCKSLSNAFVVKIGNLKPGKILSQPVLAKNGILTVCEGINANLSISDYTNKTDIEITWLKDGKQLPLLNNSESVFAKEKGVYRYILKQGNCEVLSESINLQYGNMRGFDLFSLTGTTVCAGQKANLLVNSRNNQITNNSFNYKLYRGQEVIGDIPFIFDFLRISESGAYHVKGNFGEEECFVYSDTAIVTISDKVIPFQIYNGITEIQTCSDSTLIGKSVNLTGINASNVKYNWLYNDKVVENNNLKTLNAKQTGSYVLTVVIDSSCQYKSQPLKVSLKDITVKVTSTSVLCSDNLAELTVQTDSENTRIQNINGDLFFGNEITYQWYSGIDTLGNTKSQTVSKSGIYRAAVELNECNISTNPFPVVLLEINKTLSPLADTLGLCPNGGFVNIHSEEIADAYEWINDSINAGSKDFSIYATELGKYRVWMEKNGCGAYSDTKTIIESKQKPTASLSGGEVIEIGNEAELRIDFTASGPWTFILSSGESITTSETPYIWKVAPLENTLYAITTVSNPCGFGETFGDADVIVLVLGTENESNNNLIVYPNPSVERIRITLANKSISTVDFQLINSNGVPVIEKKDSPAEAEINILRMPDGHYILKVVADDESFTRKIIIQH
jgi:hypothetical protein